MSSSRSKICQKYFQVTIDHESSLGQSCGRVVNETAESLEVTVKRENFEENLCEEEAIYISSSSETEEIVDIGEIF